MHALSKCCMLEISAQQGSGKHTICLISTVGTVFAYGLSLTMTIQTDSNRTETSLYPNIYHILETMLLFLEPPSRTTCPKTLQTITNGATQTLVKQVLQVQLLTKPTFPAPTKMDFPLIVVPAEARRPNRFPWRSQICGQSDSQSAYGSSIMEGYIRSYKIFQEAYIR